MSALRFITLRRINRGSVDTSSLSLSGRQNTPGALCVVGNLEHGAQIAPLTEADRLALVAYLESDECKALVASPIATAV
jgi:hypothetical protein